MLCANIVLNVKTKTKFLYTICCELEFLGNSMNNLLSYCGLSDTRMRASEKDYLYWVDLDVRAVLINFDELSYF